MLKTKIKITSLFTFFILLFGACKLSSAQAAIPESLISIKLNRNYFPSNYFIGDELNLDDLSVTAFYSDETEKELSEYEVQIINPDGEIQDYTENFQLQKKGFYTIKVLFETKEDSFQIYSAFKSDVLLNQSSGVNIDLYKTDFSSLEKLKVTMASDKKGKSLCTWFRIVYNPEKDLFNYMEVPNSKKIFDLDGISEYYTSTIEIPEEDFQQHKVHSNFYICKFINMYEDETVILESKAIEVKCQLPQTGLKTIIINTEKEEEPRATYTHSMDNNWGVIDETKVPGRLQIIDNSNILYDSGEYEKNESGMTIKIRGNRSAYNTKKPYKIKLQKKEDLLFRGDSKYKDKEWILLANGTSSYNLIGLTFSRLVGFSWIPSFEYVDLIVNNEYKGTYILCECVKSSSSRIDVSKTGYIVERDPYYKYEDKYFITKNKQWGYSFKEPDTDDLTQEQIDYIKSVLDAFEDSLNTLRADNDNLDYENYLDTKSLIRWHLVHELLGTQDAGGANKYFSKKNNKKESKLITETPWDFDTIFRLSTEDWGLLHKTFYLPDLLRSEKFRKEYVAEYNNIKNLTETLFSELETYSSKYGDSIEASRKLDELRWKNVKDSYVAFTSMNSEINTAKNWINSKIIYLNTEIPALIQK